MLISDSLTLSYLSVEWSPLCQSEGKRREERRKEGLGGEKGRDNVCVCVFFFFPEIIIICTGKAITANYYTSDVISKIRSHVIVAITCTFSTIPLHHTVSYQTTKHSVPSL